MKIINLIQEIIRNENNTILVRANKTILVNPERVPKAKHIIFAGLSQEIIFDFFTSMYAQSVPTQYVKFLESFNGANLFMYKITAKKVQFAGTGLVLYGIPRTSPYNRPLDMEEPFDVRIEDLRRHKGISEKWLQIGRFADEEGTGTEQSIYVDCVTGSAFTCKVDDCVVVEHWQSIDECLCDLFSRCTTYKDEYFFEK